MVSRVHVVELITREGCGSCVRIHNQILPVIEETGAQLEIRPIEADEEYEIEYGDRVPVILIDGEEFACWEVDNDELRVALIAQ